MYNCIYNNYKNYKDYYCKPYLTYKLLSLLTINITTTKLFIYLHDLKIVEVSDHGDEAEFQTVEPRSYGNSSHSNLKLKFT